MKLFKHQISSLRAGFTLVELLVTLSIFSLITTLIITRNTRFNSEIFLNNLAYDIAQTVRQAQVYALSVRQEALTGSFNSGYGVSFDSTNPNSFIFFVDINGNGFYDNTAPDETLDIYTIGQGNQIGLLCALTTAGVEKCTKESSLVKFSIIFKRPDLDALITSNIAGEQYHQAAITIISPFEQSRIISVASTGQISVVNPALIATEEEEK